MREGSRSLAGAPSLSLRHRPLGTYQAAAARGGGRGAARGVGSARVHEDRGGARAVSRHAARAVGSSRRDALGRRAGGKGGRGEAVGARSKMAVQESAAQLSMTLKVQEYPTLKVGARPPPARGERVNALSVPPEQR